MADVRGFWIGRGDRQRLCWCIDGEFISDHALRTWVWHNVPGIMRYVDVIRQCQCDAYANRHQSAPASQ
jgi:hypothetical protein